MRTIRIVVVSVLLSWMSFMPANNVRADSPTDEELKALEQQIEQQEAKQAEAQKRADAEAKRKAEEEVKRKAEEDARLKVEEESKRKAEEETKKQAVEAQRLKEEDAARQHAAEAARKIAVYIGLNVATSTHDYYSITLEPGRCLMENIEKSLSAIFSTVKMVNSDKLSDTERSEVGFLLVVTPPELKTERKGLATSLFELTNLFFLFTPDGNRIENYTEKNSTNVTTASLSIADNIKTAKDAVCTLTNNNLAGLVGKISSITRERNP